VNTKRYVL